MTTLVIGLGNPLLTDDGVGVLTARAVQEALAAHPIPAVEVIEASVGGLRLMELMAGSRRVVLIDAWVEDSLPPGTVCRLTLADLEGGRPPQHLASAHDATLPTALAAGRRLGLDLPEDIVIVAVTVGNVTDFDETPTPAVLAAVPTAVAAVLAELRKGMSIPA
jgi:hydrogenase maturation protease